MKTLGRPFDHCEFVQVVASSDRIIGLLEEHRSPIERELGAKIQFTQTPNPDLPTWLIGPISEKPCTGPEIHLNRKTKLLISNGRTLDEVIETFSYLRSLPKFEGGIWSIEDSKTVDEAIDRIVNEIGNSYPSFKLRNLNWQSICERHIPLVRAAIDPIPAMQRWLSELDDAHTWVRPVPAFWELPYDLFVKHNTGWFYNVPEDSKAWSLGVRPGDELLEEPYKDWWERTSATPHSKPFIVGKRILSSPPNSLRSLKVKTKKGKLVAWEEVPLANRWSPAVTYKRLETGCGYIKIKAWLLDQKMDESIDEAFKLFQNVDKLIVDLRGSPGGNLLMAHAFRNRFLEHEGPVGYIQTTLPDGTLGPRDPIMGKIPPEYKRWKKPVVFLTDALTYSSSEDAILGLQGLKNVKVIGQRSGGGSGRMRLIKLLPGYRLTISTAITYDLNGAPIEAHGIPLDHEIAFDIANNKDTALDFAERTNL